MNELRPYIKINSGATGPTIIQNSELAYLGYSCNGCGGVSFNGGNFSILKNNDIHHIYFENNIKMASFYTLKEKGSPSPFSISTSLPLSSSSLPSPELIQ